MELHTTHGDLSLHTIAAQGGLFLKSDLHLVGITKSVNDLEGLFYLASALLDRQQDWSGGHAIRKGSGLAEDSLSGEPNCDKLVADLQHILRSLQEIALEAIIRHYLNVFEAHILHWHLYWQHSKRIGEGWFAEWPNGHRPLSTTWPWNIKPSLLVLWGVCWMFHGPSGDNKRRPTRNPRGAANLSENLRTGPLTSQSQPSEQESKFSRQRCYDFFSDNLIIEIDSSEAWAGPASNTYPNYLWPHPTEVRVARRANNDDSESHVQVHGNAQSWDHSMTNSRNRHRES